MRLALTADLHWGHNKKGDEATRALLDHLRTQPPDVLLLGGDQGTENHFRECLELFAEFSCPKALVPGNHDVWVSNPDSRGDSLDLFDQYLPRICADTGFHYLDHGPLVLAESLAIVGTMNWYDYSWSVEKLKKEDPHSWEWRLRDKLFTRGRHNDGRFVRWSFSDVTFTERVVGQFAQHLQQALDKAERALVLTHHPACYGLNFPREHEPVGWDSLLWDALSGNAALEGVLGQHADRLAAIFSGHTHRARSSRLNGAPAYNIGGDYHFKRMVTYDWPTGAVEFYEFHA